MTRSVHLGSALMYFMLTESAMWFSHFLSTSKQACQVVHVNILICVLYKTKVSSQSLPDPLGFFSSC